MDKKTDFKVGVFFAAATIILIILFFANDNFFNWAFGRHRNTLSWYIRPLFILPIIFFAFKKSYAGISISIFALFTSMFWFPVPETINPQVSEFLAFEMDYLKGVWTGPKIFMSLAVPIFFIMLILSAWNRNWKWLIAVIIGSAVLKLIWSLLFGGETGMAILFPATIGLIACVGGFYLFYRRFGKNRKDF